MKQTNKALRWRFDPLKNFRRKAPTEIIVHLLVSVIFMAVALSYLYIFVWAVLAAVRTHTEIVMDPFGLPEMWHWDHFGEVFEKLTLSNGADFWDMLFNSIYFSVGAVGVAQFTTVTFAYCCTKYKFPGSSLVYPIIIVMIRVAQVARYDRQLHPHFGVGERFLGHLPLLRGILQKLVVDVC